MDLIRSSLVYQIMSVLRKDSGVLNNGYDNEDFDYILHANDVLSSPEGDDYIVIELLGTGTFGQVRAPLSCLGCTTVRE